MCGKNLMIDIINSFDYRKGKKNGGREALRQVGYLMQQIKQENDFENYEDSWNQLFEKICESLDSEVTSND